MSYVKRLYKLLNHRFSYETFYDFSQGFVCGSLIVSNFKRMDSSVKDIVKTTNDQMDPTKVKRTLVACTLAKSIIYGYMGPIGLAYMMTQGNVERYFWTPGSIVMNPFFSPKWFLDLHLKSK